MHQEQCGVASPLWLYTLPNAPAVGRVRPQDGAPLPPPPGSIVLERSVSAVRSLAVGDVVTVRLSDGDTYRLTVAGFVHDMAVPPTTVQPTVYGYISDETAGRLGLADEANQLVVRLEEGARGQVPGAREERSALEPGTWNLEPSRAEVETVVTEVADWLAHEGVVVGRAGIPEPGVHLMQGNVDTGLLMIGILGGLTLLLGAFVVTNVISAVVAQQTPQIGVLKALGAGRGLVARQYGRMVLIFGGLALLLAVPLGLVGAWAMSSMLAGQLNYDIPSFGLTWSTLLVQAAGALLLPLLAALGPLRAAARLSIREALAGEERSSRQGRQGSKGAKEEKKAFSFLPWRLRPFAPWRELFSHKANTPPATHRSSLLLVALRNVARRPARLALTVAALALAGALFMATFGLRQGLYGAVEILVGEFGADAQIDLAEPQAAARLRRAAAGLDGVARVELWGVADGRRLYDDGRAGSSFTLYGVPPTTQIAPFAERAGRWLSEQGPGSRFQVPGEEPSSLAPGPWNLEPPLYINYETEKLLGRPGVGEALALRLNGRQDATARLVGISLRPFDPAAYMPYADFERATGERGRAGRLVIYLTEELTPRRGVSEGAKEEEAFSLRLGSFAPWREPLSQPAEPAPTAASVAEALAGRLAAGGVVVAAVETADSFRAGYRAQFDGLVALLMALAGLTALVGGLGLGNTMALNVLERSREIGVLRALGARRPLLRRLVLAEGLLIAVSSVALAALLAVPLTAALGRVMGVSLLGSPLRLAFVPGAAAAWLGLVVLIAVVACWLPAERAGRMGVREALAYE
jgi:putative ABC transport system permease protein